MTVTNESRSDALLASAIVWDNHTCMPLDPHGDRFLPQLERLRAAGVTVAGLNVGYGEQDIESHVRMLAHFRSWIKNHSDRYLCVEHVGDVGLAKASGRLGIFFDIEGANAVGDQLSLVSLYYDLGVRWMLMAYNRNNRVGGGCLDDDAGLTPFGLALVAEMNRVGMVPCCSHTGKRTALEVIAASSTPVILSHSNPRAVWNHPRNVDDELIRACARRGGVIGINGVGPFLGDDATSETLARHVDYAVQLVGVEHVGIGLDYVFDQDELQAAFAATPHLFGADAQRYGNGGCEFASPEQIPELAAELAGMGYSDGDLRSVLGANWLRVAREVWK